MRIFVFILCLITFLGCAYEGSKGRIDIINPTVNLYNQGMDYYIARNYDMAIRSFRDIVEYYPDNPLADKALIMLATCYEEMGNYRDALGYYRLYVVKYPNGKDIDTVKRKIDRLQRLLDIEK
ncbi:MAG: tetratricopeptide repeat protein [Thermosulfidibacteraceae bacterium]|jgi:outer membrane protein assembly factor BamD (BamD/ComL family)